MSSPEPSSSARDGYDRQAVFDEIEAMGSAPEHREVERETVPAYSHEDTGYRVTCACGRRILSVFPWLIRKWLVDHDSVS